MPRLGPIKRAQLIRYLRELGFQGPERGGKPQIMRRGPVTLLLPNPHCRDIGVGLLARILREEGISKDDWEPL